jgi:hypothetical protein
VPAGVAKNCERLRQMYVETGGSASSGVQGQRAEMLSRSMQGGERGRERNSRGVKPEEGKERRGEVGEGAEGTRQVDQVFAISIITEHGRKDARPPPRRGRWLMGFRQKTIQPQAARRSPVPSTQSASAGHAQANGAERRREHKSGKCPTIAENTWIQRAPPLI